MFKPEEIPWEIWTIKIEQMQLSSENGRIQSNLSFVFKSNSYFQNDNLCEKNFPIRSQNEYSKSLKSCSESFFSNSIIFSSVRFSNKPDYVPKPPHLSELDLVFDTSYTDIQPYLFKVTLVSSKFELNLVVLLVDRFISVKLQQLSIMLNQCLKKHSTHRSKNELIPFLFYCTKCSFSLLFNKNTRYII